MKLLEKLENNELIPFHMPAHKRNVNLASFLKTLRADLDVTEIDGMDNLSDPEEVILESMEKASRLWNCDKSFFLVGGSTCGILSAFRTLTNEGDSVLMGRVAHKSAYNAIELFGLNPVFLKGEIYNSRGIYQQISVEDVENSLKENGNIKLLFLTSPTYEGFVANIKGISEVCKKYDVKILIDEAHGSHLGFHDYFHKSAITQGADVVVQSLHKMSLGLTQTAIIHCQKSIDTKKLQKNINIFQSSSPSYILLSSICENIDFLENGEEAFQNWVNNLEFFYEKTKNLKKLKVIDFPQKDKSKLLIDTSKSSVNGKELMEILRKNYKIELEMAYADCALAMTGLGDVRKNIEIFANALIEIDENIFFEEKEVFFFEEFSKKMEISIKEAKKLSESEIKIGEISTKYMWIYPPAVPIIIPSERISEKALNIAQKLSEKGSKIYISD